MPALKMINRAHLTDTTKTFAPSALANCLHLFVICGSPAGMNVYPGGGFALNETYGCWTH